MSETDASTSSVEIIQTVSRRRWTSSQKLSMVEESMQPGNSVSRVARHHGVTPANSIDGVNLCWKAGRQPRNMCILNMNTIFCQALIIGYFKDTLIKSDFLNFLIELNTPPAKAGGFTLATKVAFRLKPV